MIGSEIKATVKESNENNDVHIGTEIDYDISPEEALAAVGSIATDLCSMTGLDIEAFISVMRHMHYEGF